MTNPTNTTITYEVPTWNQIYKMLLQQTQKIQKSLYKPDLIIGITNGGTVPTRILSDLLQIPQTTTINIKSYTNINQLNTRPILKQHINIPINGKKILLIDDISDTGQTLKTAKHHLIEKGATETKTASLYTKPTTKTRPDFTEKITNHWIVFPWEIKETIQNILQQQKNKQTATNAEFAKLIKSGLPKHFIKQIIKTIPDAQQLDTALL